MTTEHHCERIVADIMKLRPEFRALFMCRTFLKDGEPFKECFQVKTYSDVKFVSQHEVVGWDAVRDLLMGMLVGIEYFAATTPQTTC